MTSCRNLRKGAPPYPTVPIAIHLGRVYDPQINEMHEESILVRQSLSCSTQSTPVWPARVPTFRHATYRFRTASQWPLGDPALTPQAVAGALCKQVGHSSAEMVGQVQGQIEYALRKFDGYKAGGEMSHADIELHVVYEGHEFKDTGAMTSNALPSALVQKM